MDDPPASGAAPEAIERYQAAMAGFWHPVLPAERLGAAPVAVRLLGRALVLARLDGAPRCFDDLCRHLGAALSIGEICDSGTGLRCRYHGWTYGADGVVTDIPARRGAPIPREARVPAYHCTEQDGLIWVCLAARPLSPIPAFPEFSDPRFRITPLQTYAPWRASVCRVIMAALDDTHFPWVHPGLLGDPGHPEPPDHRVWREGDELISTYTVLQPANPSIGGSRTETADLLPTTYTNHCTATTIRLVKDSPAGRFALWQAAVPISHDQTLVMLRTARDFDLDPAADREYCALEDQIQAQDRPVVESQRPWLLPPLSSRMMLYIRPADLPLIAYQRWMEELGIPQI